MKKTTLLYIIIFYIFSCSQSEREIILEKHDDGSPKIVHYYKGDQLIKMFEYFNNTKIKYERYYNN